ncbi:unnamed protein product, partial [Choristocarpus tenellus]
MVKEGDEWDEILGEGVMMKALTDGNGVTPELAHLVSFDYTLKVLVDGEVGDTCRTRTGAMTRIGDGDVIPGLELALRHMREGQRCLVRSQSRFSFGPEGCPALESEDRDVPPNADLELDVKLSRVVSSTAPEDMTPEENLADCKFKKDIGNEHFRCKAYKKALRSYTSALTAISRSGFTEGSNQYLETRKLQTNCGNNVAIAFLRLGELEKAKDSILSVLELEPDNIKALYRAGQISNMQGNFVEAKLALQKALEIEPKSVEIKAEMRNLAARIKDYRQKSETLQKKMGESMFSSGN